MRIRKLIPLIGLVLLIAAGAIFATMNTAPFAIDHDPKPLQIGDEVGENSQTDPKMYDRPAAFVVNAKLSINDAAPVSHSQFGKTVKECSDAGDQMIAQITRRLGVDPEVDSSEEDVVMAGDVEDAKVLAIFDVNEDRLSLISGEPDEKQQERAQELFAIFAQLVPSMWREDLTKVEIYQHGSFGAYIAVDEENERKRVLGLDLEAFDGVQDIDIMTLMIHEFAHLFSMDDEQMKDGIACVDPNGDTIDCSKPESYINQFNQQFWSNVDENWRDNGSKHHKDVEEFYRLNKENFINSYAVNDPYEDFAESFLSFVIENRPENEREVVEQKMLFFYQYPELVELRAELLDNMIEIGSQMP